MPGGLNYINFDKLQVNEMTVTQLFNVVSSVWTC